ncbi:MAG: aldehyde reductase [Spirochaetia bacterium]|nr:aldehyde reductase [Spirochaetia bacterium]
MLNKKKVTVTGGSGFLASHCILQLLQNGYSVKTTIRNKSREKDIRNLLSENVKYSANQLTFIEADLTSDKNWDEAVKGSTCVLHVASPLPAGIPKDAENELIKPAVEGTLRVLTASLNNKVKRVVMTSSMAAISYGHPYPKNISMLDENTWSDVHGKDNAPYMISKTLAEKAAWNFIENKASRKLELVTINPSAILGPILGNECGTSALIVKKVLDRDVPALPNLGFQIVDVRDVALAHLKAMTLPEANGKRIIITDRFVWFTEIAAILAEEFAPQGYKIPRLTIPDFLVKLFSLFDKETKGVLFELGIKRELSNKRMKTLLGISPIPAKESILTTARTLISKGLIKSK